MRIRSCAGAGSVRYGSARHARLRLFNKTTDKASSFTVTGMLLRASLPRPVEAEQVTECWCILA